jgi:hypothetical protein
MSSRKLLPYWQCEFVIRMVILVLITQWSGGWLDAKCPTNWSRSPPSVTYCLQLVWLFVLALMNSYVLWYWLLVIPGIQKKNPPWNFEVEYEISSWCVTRSRKFQYSFLIWCVVWMLVPTSVVDCIGAAGLLTRLSLHILKAALLVLAVWYIIIIIIYLSWSWTVPVSRIQKSLQKSAMIPSAIRGVVFHYPGWSITRHWYIMPIICQHRNSWYLLFPFCTEITKN